MNIKDIIFFFLTIIHNLIWTFILLSFINSKTAYINFFIIIPIIYILHMLPFHILIDAKKYIIPDELLRENKIENIDKKFIIPYYFVKTQKFLEKKCLFSPLSAQGMLILGALTSGYTLIKKNDL